MCGLWAGLVHHTGVSPFSLCHALVRLNVLFFFFFQLILHRLYFCGRRVRSFAIWQSDRNKFTNRKKTGLRTQNGWPKKKKKKPWFRIRLRDSEVTPWHFFQEMISNLCHQKSVKKVKKSKKVKVKAFFLVGGQTGEDCLPYLTDGLKSHVCHCLNRDLEGAFVFLSEKLQRYLSFRKWFLKKY